VSNTAGLYTERRRNSLTLRCKDNDWQTRTKTPGYRHTG